MNNNGVPNLTEQVFPQRCGEATCSEKGARTGSADRMTRHRPLPSPPVYDGRPAGRGRVRAGPRISAKHAQQKQAKAGVLVRIAVDFLRVEP